jgi:hypothetical protein
MDPINYSTDTVEIVMSDFNQKVSGSSSVQLYLSVIKTDLRKALHGIFHNLSSLSEILFKFDMGDLTNLHFIIPVCM